MVTATTRPTKLDQPFTRWSIRKLAAYLRTTAGRAIRIGREALRCLLAAAGFFPAHQDLEGIHRPRRGRQARPHRICDRALPDRTFAFDEFGPLGIRPTGGTCWAAQGRPDRVAATYHRTHGARYFHG